MCWPTPYEWGVLGLSGATLYVLARTLVRVSEYTEAARQQLAVSERTAKAASDQAEAALMPVVVVLATLDRSQEQFDASYANTDAGALPKLPNQTIVLGNIGGGPALSVAFRISNPGNKKRPSSARRNFVLAPRPSDQQSVLDTQFKVGWLLDPADVLIEYTSASGTKYQNFTTLELRNDGVGNPSAYIKSQNIQRLDT
jgi:hypothetical protein